MGYADGEKLLEAVILEHHDWTAQNVARADWRLLNSGNSAFYAILRPGPASFADDSIGGLGTVKRKRVRIWRTEVLVYQRYTKDGASAIALQERVGDLVDHLEQYPRLGDTTGTVRTADVVGTGEIQETQLIANGPMWVMWPILVDWTEENEVSET